MSKFFCLVCVFCIILGCRRTYSNFDIVSKCMYAFESNKESLSYLVVACDSLCLTNEACQLEVYYRAGWDSVPISYIKNIYNNNYKFTKKVPKSFITSSMVLGDKSYSFRYKKGDVLSMPYGGQNYMSQESRLVYCFNQKKYINENVLKLDVVYEVDRIKENSKGLIYVLDNNWIVLIK